MVAGKAARVHEHAESCPDPPRAPVLYGQHSLDLATIDDQLPDRRSRAYLHAAAQRSLLDPALQRGTGRDPALAGMCRWIKDNLGDDVPLHFSRFMPSFRLQNLPPTPIEKIDVAYRIAKEVGLKYVYVGNVPGDRRENTHCPNCKRLVVGRVGYSVIEVNIVDRKMQILRVSHRRHMER